MNGLLSLFYFFYFAVIGVYIVFLPKVLSMIGYSASEIGVVFSAGPLVRFVLPFAFIKGLKLNTTNFNIALLLLLFGTFSFFITISNFYTLLASNIIFGVGLSMVLPYLEVIALEYIGKERYGKVRLFGSIGFILVALVLVRFLSSAQVAIGFLSFVVFWTVVFAFVIVKNYYHGTSASSQSINDVTILKDWRLWLGLTLMQVAFGPFYNFFTIYETDFGVPLDMTIYLWSFGVIVEVFMLFFQGAFLKKNLLKILQITTLASSFRWFLVFSFPQNIYIIFFSQSIHALSFALFHSASISYLFTLYKHKTLAQQLFFGLTYGLGGFVGAMYAGYVYEFYPTYLFLSASFIAFLSFLSIRSIR